MMGNMNPMNPIQIDLNQYYEDMGIAPVNAHNGYAQRFRAFGCPHKDYCRDSCYGYWKKKDKQSVFCFSPPIEGVHVSDYYANGEYLGNYIPRIVVISLSSPEPDMPADEPIVGPLGRYAHWRETLAMVRSLLHPFIGQDANFPGPISRWEDPNREIVESLFVHTRTAKCCSNADGGGREPDQVYEICGSYLGEEIAILEPDVIITQGDQAHPRAEKYVFNNFQEVMGIEGIDPVHNVAHVATLRCNNNPVFWLRLYHPGARGRYYAQAGDKIALEHNVVGAMRENFVHNYGPEIQQFIAHPDAYLQNVLNNQDA